MRTLRKTVDKLTDRSECILQMIAAAASEQELSVAIADIGVGDFKRAAREALVLNAKTGAYQARVSKILKQYPRAYEKWCQLEEETVKDLHLRGKTLREISAIVQRQPNAIKARLERLG